MISKTEIYHRQSGHLSAHRHQNACPNACPKVRSHHRARHHPSARPHLSAQTIVRHGEHLKNLAQNLGQGVKISVFGIFSTLKLIKPKKISAGK